MKERTADPFFHVLFCPLGMDVIIDLFVWSFLRKMESIGKPGFRVKYSKGRFFYARTGNGNSGKSG
jgi:hypothetical protein